MRISLLFYTDFELIIKACFNVLIVPSKKGEDINLNLTIDKGQELCSDDDEEDMNDYTISMDSVDKILMELSQAQ